MDKSSERYKKLCENQKFQRREARLWWKALHKHNMNVIRNSRAPEPPEYMKGNL